MLGGAEGCRGDAGLRPRWDLLRKGSEGMYSLILASPGVTAGISPSWGLHRVVFVGSVLTEAGMVLVDYVLSRYIVPFHEHLQVQQIPFCFMSMGPT